MPGLFQLIKTAGSRYGIGSISDLMLPAGQRLSGNTKLDTLHQSAAQRGSAALNSLRLKRDGAPGSEDATNAELTEEERKRKLLESQRGNVLSTAFRSLMGQNGNQF